MAATSLKIPLTYKRIDETVSKDAIIIENDKYLEKLNTGVIKTIRHVDGLFLIHIVHCTQYFCSVNKSLILGQYWID